MIGSFLYNAAFAAPEGKDNVSSDPTHGRMVSAAWFFFVACVLSITLRALDQRLFSDEDAGTSELCAFGAFVVGAVVSMKSHTSTTIPARPPSPGSSTILTSAGRGTPISVPPHKKTPQLANSDQRLNAKNENEIGMSPPSTRRSSRTGNRDAGHCAPEAAIQLVLGSEETVDAATLAQGIVACCKLGKFAQAEKWLGQLVGARVPPGLELETRVISASYASSGSGISSARIVIDACLGAGEVSRAAVWLGQLHAAGLKPTARTITTVLESLVKIGELEKAEQLLSRLVAAAASVDATCYQTIFEHCIPKNDCNRIEGWLQKSKEMGPSELAQAYIALIRSFAQQGDAIQAERWLIHAIEADAAKSTHCYNAVIHACVRVSDIARAERWLQHMEQVSMESVLDISGEQRFAPDVISYSAIMDAYAQQGKSEQAEAWFARMIGGGIRPDSVSFNTVIKAHARSGNISGAERWLQCARKHGVVLDSFGYNAVIAAAARANEPETAEHWLNQMLQDGAQPDVVSYNSVINAWAKRGAASAAERLVHQMCQVHVEPDVVTLGAATHACAKAGDADRADAIFARILSRGKTRADAICYNALIDACVKSGDTRRAEARLSEMVSDGVAPSVVSYTTVLHAHARNGDVEAAERGLERMLDAGVEANVVSYSALIGACVKAGDIDRAERWFDRMRTAGIRANNVSYSVLLNVCAKAGDSVRAEKWLENMCAEGVAPNAVCFNNVIDACAKAGLPDRAEMWLRRLCHVGPVNSAEMAAVDVAAASVRPTRQSFTTAAQAYATRGAWLDAERLMGEMQARGISMDEFSLTVLMSAYSRGRPRQRERGETAFRRHVAAGLPITKPPLRVLRSLVGVARFDAICCELQIKVPRENSFR